MRYLYRSPPLTASSLLLLTESVLRGDKKWDDTRLHPHSIPGRFVRTLDLSTISLTMTDFGDDFDDDPPGPSRYGRGNSNGNKGPSPHVTALARACAALMPLLPNVTHLRLPPVGGGAAYEAILDTVRRAPFVSKLRAVEGLQVPGGVVRARRRQRAAEGIIALDQGAAVLDEDTPTNQFELDWRQGESLLELLRRMRDVEYLSFAGQGLGADTWPPGSAEILESPHGHFPSLDLPNLHTLRLDSLPSSPLLGALAASFLPSLTRLLITAYTPMPLSPSLANTHSPDLTLALLQAHGQALRSLTLLPTREWPPVHPLPADEVFERYCTDLRHVSILLPMTAFAGDKEGAARFGKVLARRGSKIERVTLAKWAQRSGGSPSPSPAVHTVPLPNAHAGHAGGGADHLGMGALAIHASGPVHGQKNGKKLAPLPNTHPFLLSLVTWAAASASPAPHNSSQYALAIDDTTPVPILRTVTIDGLTSVSPNLSFAARDAGANGEMRAWAIGMAQRTIKMLDGAGQGVLSQHHALSGITESLGAGPSASGPSGLGSPGQRYAFHGSTSPIVGGSYGAAVGSWSDLSPIAAAVAAGSGMGMRRSSAGEWDERGRRRSRGGGMQGMGGFGIQVGLGGHRQRGESDEDDGG